MTVSLVGLVQPPLKLLSQGCVQCNPLVLVVLSKFNGERLDMFKFENHCGRRGGLYWEAMFYNRSN